MSKPIIAVAGATGQQGGAVARALLRKGKFAVRAFTRNPDSAKAKKMKEAGAEVVRADLDGETSALESVLQGAHGAFLVTNFWEHGNAAREYKQGTQFIDAAKKAGVKHLIMSGLENVEKITGGRLKCPHFSTKGRVEEYLANSDLDNHSIVRLAMYADTTVSMMVQKDPKNPAGFCITLPCGHERVHQISVEDLGPVVAAMFEQPEEYRGKVVKIAGDYLTFDDVAAAISRVGGKPVRYQPIPVHEYRQLPYPGTDDMADMFEFYLEEGEKLRDVDLTRKLNPGVETFEDFLKSHRDVVDQVLSS